MRRNSRGAILSSEKVGNRIAFYIIGLDRATGRSVVERDGVGLMLTNTSRTNPPHSSKKPGMDVVMASMLG